MSVRLKRRLLNWVSRLAGKEREQSTTSPRRILVIRRNHIGDMICTLPLLHSLRHHFPEAVLDVACDCDGVVIAKASGVVNHVHLLQRKRNPYISAFFDARKLQGYDIVMAVKVGFDRRLAFLARLTQAPVRIGFEHSASNLRSLFYTRPLLPQVTSENQVDSCLRLLKPLEIKPYQPEEILRLSPESVEFAKNELEKRSLHKYAFLAVINLSSHRPIKWPQQNFMELIRRLIQKKALVALSSAPQDREKAEAFIREINTPALFLPETSTILDLGAILQKAAFVFTPEGGVTHLAAALKTPALIFWSSGHFTKWNTRAANHRYLRADLAREIISVDHVWKIVENEFLPTVVRSL